jgi:hypothetical protein
MNGVLAVVWSVILMFGLGRAAAASSFAKKSAARRDSRKLFRRMQDPDCTAEQFLDMAGEFVCSRLKSNGAHSDVSQLLENSRASDETKSAIRTVLSRHDEGRYSANGAKLDVRT